jgi:tetratricopeptide (TPR) repeat protein
MALKDIAKLKEKIEKDPNSKLFVPLSEEYKKEGMLDEAINVLLSGIEKQPGYMSARVALGKIYLEKEMPKEAQGEFEQVIKAIPDNLYAHKKLAEIYRSMGHTEQAVRSYKTVLKLNAMDEDAMINLSELESSESEPADKKTPASPPEPARPIFTDEVPSEAADEHMHPESFSDEKVMPEPIKEGELAAFHSAIFGGASADDSTAPEDMPISNYNAPGDTAAAIANTAETETAEEDEAGVFELEEPQDEEFYEKTFSAPEEITEEILAEPETVKPAEPLKKTEAVLSDGDKFISEGSYVQALSLYRTLLAAAPGDKKVLQRVEELTQLLKMMGKGKEALVEQLNNLLKGINNKRDEFFRNT